MCVLCKFTLAMFVLLLIHDVLVAVKCDKLEKRVVTKSKTIRTQRKRITNLETEISKYIGADNIKVADAFNKEGGNV